MFQIMGQAGVFPAIYPNRANTRKKIYPFHQERIWVDSACLKSIPTVPCCSTTSAVT